MDPSDPYVPRVLEVVCFIHAKPDADDEALVAQLRSVGYAELDAELATIFVPLAFGRVLLGRAGIARFPDTYFAKDGRGRWVA